MENERATYNNLPNNLFRAFPSLCRIVQKRSGYKVRAGKSLEIEKGNPREEKATGGELPKL